MEKCITPISLGLSSKVHTHKQMHSQTFTLTKKGAVFKEPGATTARLLCETFIIYDVFDVVICINIRGIFIRLKQLKKNFVKSTFHFLRNYFCRKKKLQSGAWTPAIQLFIEKRKKLFHLLFFYTLLILVPGFYKGYLMAQLVAAPQCPIQSANESIFIDQCLCKAYR